MCDFGESMSISNINVNLKDMTDMIKTLANLDGGEIFRLCVLFIVFSIGVSVMIHGIPVGQSPSPANTEIVTPETSLHDD